MVQTPQTPQRGLVDGKPAAADPKVAKQMEKQRKELEKKQKEEEKKSQKEQQKKEKARSYRTSVLFLFLACATRLLCAHFPSLKRRTVSSVRKSENKRRKQTPTPRKKS